MRKKSQSTVQDAHCCNSRPDMPGAMLVLIEMNSLIDKSWKSYCEAILSPNAAPLERDVLLERPGTGAAVGSLGRYRSLSGDGHNVVRVRAKTQHILQAGLFRRSLRECSGCTELAGGA